MQSIYIGMYAVMHTQVIQTFTFELLKQTQKRADYLDHKRGEGVSIFKKTVFRFGHCSMQHACQ